MMHKVRGVEHIRILIGLVIPSVTEMITTRALRPGQKGRANQVADVLDEEQVSPPIPAFQG